MHTTELLPLRYHVRLPVGREVEIASQEDFWEVVDTLALWFMRLPSDEQEKELRDRCIEEEAEVARQIGAVVASIVCPRQVEDYAALLVLDRGSIWETFYALSDADEKTEPTPRHVFDCTLRECIIAEIESNWEELVDEAAPTHITPEVIAKYKAMNAGGEIGLFGISQMWNRYMPQWQSVEDAGSLGNWHPFKNDEEKAWVSSPDLEEIERFLQENFTWKFAYL
jgi:hypothetical protein